MIKKLKLILLATLVLGGCAGASSSLATRHSTAIGIAAPAAMNERIIAAGNFNLTAWERAPKPNEPVNLYIEGDGLAWLNKYTKSMNPTPPDPLALRLAAIDQAANVIYMARPCQYSGWNGASACPDLYWTTGRTAPEVIQAYNKALDNMKETYHVSGFNLIGYSGGAGVAMLVASERQDVLSIRTVAGNTDYATFSALHGVTPMNASRDPISVAAKLTKIPQYHFIGAADQTVPPAIFDSWKKVSGSDACIRSASVADATHEKGWVEKWQELLSMPLACESPAPVVQ